MEKTSRGVIVDLEVNPNSGSFRIDASEDGIRVFCKAPPEGGRANREIVNRLSKIFRVEVSIVGGWKSRRKRVLIAGSTLERVRSIIADLER